jgi:transcriptional regulator with GAF, ATPase, and Fis domain
MHAVEDPCVIDLHGDGERAFWLAVRFSRSTVCDQAQVGDFAGAPRDVTTLEDAERHAIRRALELTRWRISGPNGAAVLLAVNPSTLRSRMALLGVRKPAP